MFYCSVSQTVVSSPGNTPFSRCKERSREKISAQRGNNLGLVTAALKVSLFSSPLLAHLFGKNPVFPARAFEKERPFSRKAIQPYLRAISRIEQFECFASAFNPALGFPVFLSVSMILPLLLEEISSSHFIFSPQKKRKRMHACNYYAYCVLYKEGYSVLCLD